MAWLAVLPRISSGCCWRLLGWRRNLLQAMRFCRSASQIGDLLDGRRLRTRHRYLLCALADRLLPRPARRRSDWRVAEAAVKIEILSPWLPPSRVWFLATLALHRMRMRRAFADQPALFGVVVVTGRLLILTPLRNRIVALRSISHCGMGSSFAFRPRSRRIRGRNGHACRCPRQAWPAKFDEHP